VRETARRAFLATVVVLGVIAVALALWKIRLLLALLFLAFTIAAAMRPGIDTMRRYGVPRGVGILVHYAALAGLVAVLLGSVVPRAIDQVREAVGNVPTSRAELRQQTRESTGLKREILERVQENLEDLPSGREVIDPALEFTSIAFEVALGIFFVLACAAYWIFERDRAVDLATSLVPQSRSKIVRDTWQLIDLKLGAYVRGQFLLVLLVATVLSLAFWAIDLPFWLLLGIFAGVVEIVPVLGPLAAGALAVGVGLTQSWGVALAAGIAVLVVRLLEDYFVIPRVLGDAVGLSPLVVLVSVAATAILFGGFAVLLAIPAAAVLATLVDVIVHKVDPAQEDVPTVLFPAKDAETTSGS
jgi:predicted PurR-regulated permease PerM